MSEKELFVAVRNKRVPQLRKKAGVADLSLQEFEIMKAASECNSLDKVNVLLDKCVMYIALAKCLNLEVK